MKHLLVVTFFLCLVSVSAQDVIVKKDGSTILSKVLEVNTADIKYKKHSNPDGPIYTMDKSEILSINYENGDRDTFNETNPSKEEDDENDRTPKYIEKPADSRNSDLMKKYNRDYSLTDKLQKKRGTADEYMFIFWLSPTSIISNDEIEVTLERHQTFDKNDNYGWDHVYYSIVITNKTDKIIYVDKGNCFRFDNMGDSYCYYGDTETTTISHNQGHGTSFNLGGFTNGLGIGGLAGSLANATNINNMKFNTVSKTYSQQRLLAIPPHGKRNLTDKKYIMVDKKTIELIESEEVFDFVQLNNSIIKIDFAKINLNNNRNYNFHYYQEGLKKGKSITYNEDESPYSREYYIIYSNDPNFTSYSSLKMKWYLHEAIGCDKLHKYDWAGSYLEPCDEDYIEGIDEFSIIGCYTAYDKWFQK